MYNLNFVYLNRKYFKYHNINIKKKMYVSSTNNNSRLLYLLIIEPHS